MHSMGDKFDNCDTTIKRGSTCKHIKENRNWSSCVCVFVCVCACVCEYGVRVEVKSKENLG